MSDREKVIEVARSYLGTPFHDGARLKGVGIDCAQLLAAVYSEAALIESPKIEPYSPQFMLHRDEPLFEQHVLKFAHEIDEAAAQMGDIVLYQVGRSFAHGAIIVDWPRWIIHAFKSFRAVAETGAFDADLRGRKTKFFSMW